MRKLAMCLYATVAAGACVAQDNESDSGAESGASAIAPFAEQAQSIADATTVTISRTNNGVAFDPPSLTVDTTHALVDIHTTDVSGTLNVPPGVFSTSGTFSLGFDGGQAIGRRLQSEPTLYRGHIHTVWPCLGERHDNDRYR